MTEYIINDDWVLKRVSKESSSFKDWLTSVIKSTSKAIEDFDPLKAEEIKKTEELPELVNLDAQLGLAEKEINKAKEKIKGLGGLGGFFSNLASNISGEILSSLQQRNITTESGFNFDIDFLRGKRKSLSNTLYDVAKERGINSEGILYLIQSLPDLESFLYSTSAGKYYRDHTEHQLRVAVLGDFLLEQDLGQGQLLSHIADLSGLDKNKLKDQIWWVTGLIHDIGYPLQKITKAINYSLLNQILKCYPMLDMDVIPFEINLNSKNLEPYLQLLEEGLSKKAKELIRFGSGYEYNNKIISNVEHFEGTIDGHRVYQQGSQIQLDHGVIGALSLLRSIGTPEEIKTNRDELLGYIKAAQAIAIHNFKDQLSDYTFDNNPLAFLLILIDEMQEWGRPIPLQIRDSFFTTELKKITLLDEIMLTIDEVEWLMAYKKMQAKELIDFNFNLLCDDKKIAFSRLDKGKEFPETDIIMQDYEVKTEIEEVKAKTDNIQKIDKNKRRVSSDKDLAKLKIDSDIIKRIEKVEKIASTGLETKDIKDHKIERLLAEFRIVI
ncbi:MAG TPA: hypothetical protein VMZ29_17375 [Candidatus Bathyarchaeia archaeon]|nr:hypothetical protein [Candidatus Bathyarchaeia archaeon]